MTPPRNNSFAGLISMRQLQFARRSLSCRLAFEGNMTRIGNLLLLVLAFGWMQFTRAEDPDHILLLKLKVKDDAVVMVGHKIVPGTLKPHRGARVGRRGIRVELRTSDNEVLWTDSIPDPLSARIETFD